MVETNSKTKFVKMGCPQCESTNWYPKIDGTIVCRHCGYRGEPKTEEDQAGLEE